MLYRATLCDLVFFIVDTTGLSNVIDWVYKESATHYKLSSLFRAKGDGNFIQKLC